MSTTYQRNIAYRPTNAFMMAAWAALGIGTIAYLIGIFNAEMQLNEKGYYLIALLFGLYSAVSVQKTVRDRDEGLEATTLYYSMSWIAFGSAVILLAIGLWNAELELSEKGFFGMSFTLSLFSAITVQKNTRDLLTGKRLDPDHEARDLAEPVDVFPTVAGESEA